MSELDVEAILRALKGGIDACRRATEACRWTRRAPSLSEEMQGQLLAYLETLLRWRRKMSLVATEDPVAIAQQHIVDSFFVAPFAARGCQVADLGSGAGFPGIIVAVLCPDVQMRLIEPRRKRANFLREAVRQADLRNAVVIEGRAEKAAGEAATSGDIVVSRAFGRLQDFLEAARPLARPGSLSIAMKGPRGPDEARSLDFRFGYPDVVSYSLPSGEARALLIYEQTSMAESLAP